jgi:hypothetical protein
VDWCTRREPRPIITGSLVATTTTKAVGVSDVHVYPREFVWCLELLTRRLSEAAAGAGVHDSECTDLEAILAALPPVSRLNAEGYLKNLQLQACDDFRRCHSRLNTSATLQTRYGSARRSASR